ncbi:MAG: acireductone synthase [Oceanospirillaceae bacterium]|nr:acireductone synthase [Oceanospirillaceae bacterium]MBT10832.1 acireductone synthase [Oceanospirillaceae bacterium]|tara:strand:- start:10167 stop:10874 length:708 start_codon:yes stop_codon:yes gene_type:complete
MTVRIILTDIEGTTSSISFVKDVLFPYAAEHLPDFIRTHRQEDDVRHLLQETAQLAESENQAVDYDDSEALIRILLQWIAEDKKATPLKTLQGMIWQAGYENGDYQAHMYADAAEYLQQWHAAGMPLYVYSSGSVAAQKLFFGHSSAGNLLPLFNGFFDTRMGAKRDAQSYRNILSQLQQEHDIQAQEVLFLSDVKEELDAAAEAGLKTCWVMRDAAIPESAQHPAVHSFADIRF